MSRSARLIKGVRTCDESKLELLSSARFAGKDNRLVWTDNSLEKPCLQQMQNADIGTGPATMGVDIVRDWGSFISVLTGRFAVLDRRGRWCFTIGPIPSALQHQGPELQQVSGKFFGCHVPSV